MKHIPPTYQLFDSFEDKLELLAEEFLSHGSRLFEKELARVSSFAEQAKADTTERTDHALRSNEKEKYLLELLAFKLYDRLNRDKFNACSKTLIIVPDCLSIHEYDCQKEESSYGDICQSCHPDCQTFQITELAAKYDIPVRFSKRKLSEQLSHHTSLDGDTGVIGIACILMLANGMRSAADLGIPARGVLLHYTGCEHWNDVPFASQFAISSLQKILEEKYGS